jgi:hypothetical protein
VGISSDGVEPRLSDVLGGKKRKSFDGDFGRMMVGLEVCGFEVGSLLFSFGRRDAHFVFLHLSGGRIETGWKKHWFSEGVHRLLAFINTLAKMKPTQLALAFDM